MSECICPDYPTGVHVDCPVHPNVARNILLGLAGAVTAADDQARAMTDRELGDLLGSGRWSTTEVHEAGRRLLMRPALAGALRAADDRVTELEAALRRARADLVDVNCAGFDSTRRKLAVESLQRIEAALASRAENRQASAEE